MTTFDESADHSFHLLVAHGIEKRKGQDPACDINCRLERPGTASLLEVGMLRNVRAEIGAAADISSRKRRKDKLTLFLQLSRQQNGVEGSRLSGSAAMLSFEGG